jgi:hypothetical protein
MVAFYSPGDQELYKQFQYLPQEQFRLGLNLPKNTEAEAVNTTFGIPATNAFTNSGGDNYFAGSPNNLITDYNQITKDRYFRNQDTPLVDDLYQSKLDRTFMGFPSYKQQDPIGPFTPYNQPMNMDDPAASIENIIASRNLPLEQTMAGKIQSGIGTAKGGIQDLMGKIGGFGPISFIAKGMDKFSSLPTANQEFIKMNMGYTGPTVFGENKSGLSKDPFGINTRSLLGDYGAFVDKQVEGYEDITDEELAQLSNLQRQKINFYRQKQEEFKQVQKQILDQQMRDDKFYGGQGQSDPGDTSRSGASGRRPGSGGTVDRVTEGPGRNVDDTGQAYDSGGREGFGYGLKKGGLVSIL